MSCRVSRVLVLDGADVPPGLQSSGGVVHHAFNMLQAGALLASVRPDVVLIDAARGWHRRFVEAVRSVGPPVVAIGRPSEARGLVAVTVDRNAPPEQVVAALERAMHERRRPGAPSQPLQDGPGAAAA
jgi:hypothetical protein